MAAGLELFGVSRYLSVPCAAVAIGVLMLRGSFHRVEHLLMALASVFVAYVAAAFVVGPDWPGVARGLVVPSMPMTRDAVLIVTATVGTTLAPWGLSFIQSYAVDKRLTAADLRYERVDVVTGSVLTGLIGLCIVITCTETLFARGVSITTAHDAAEALAPLAGRFAGALFGVGLVGAALLAAAILPLSTAYSVCEYVGKEGALDDRVRDARLFYVTFLAVVAIPAAAVLLPGLPLVEVLILTQVLNAVLLVPLLVFMCAIARDRNLMREHRVSGAAAAVYAVAIGLIGLCVVALLLLGVTS